MPGVRKRSRPPRAPAKRGLVHVQTYLSTEVGEKLRARLEALRVKQSEYVRDLIERDLGLKE